MLTRISTFAPVMVDPKPMLKPPVAEISIHFRNFVRPTGVIGLPGAENLAPTTRYESNVTLSGGVNGNFKGSIFPDNLNVKGRVVDGTYPVYLGFHKAGVPTAGDLRVGTNGFRPVLVLNAGGIVPVTSNLASKKTSDGIHIHNGYSHWTAAQPMSEGCLIVAPRHWAPFISLFLNAFPDLKDWTASGGRVGKRIGSVTVTTIVYNDGIIKGRTVIV